MPRMSKKRKHELSFYLNDRHIALPPVFVYGFGAIFGKITAIEPPKISRSHTQKREEAQYAENEQKEEA